MLTEEHFNTVFKALLDAGVGYFAILIVLIMGIGMLNHLLHRKTQRSIDELREEVKALKG